MKAFKASTVLGLIIAAGLTGCSDGSAGFGGIGGGKKSESSGEASETDTSGDESPSEPVRIAGSYLTCVELPNKGSGDLADQLDKTKKAALGLTQAASDAFVACGLYSEATAEKVPISAKIFPRVLDSESEDVPVESKATSEESHYHFALLLPSESRSGATIEARIVGKDVDTSKSVQTDAVQPLFRENPGVEPPVNITSGAFDYDAAWQPPQLFAINAIDPKDFCENGEPRSEMRANNKFLTSLGGGSGQINVARGQVRVGGDSGVCTERLTTFNSFGAGGTVKSYVARAEGCIFVQTNETLYIASSANSNYGDPDDFNVLQELVEATACP